MVGIALLRGGISTRGEIRTITLLFEMGSIYFLIPGISGHSDAEWIGGMIGRFRTPSGSLDFRARGVWTAEMKLRSNLAVGREDEIPALIRGDTPPLIRGEMPPFRLREIPSLARPVILALA